MMSQYPVQFTVGRVPVQIHETREGAGAAGALRAVRALRETIERKGAARILLANGPSQNEMLLQLTADGGIDWSRVTAFHMDEYVGIGPDHPASLRNYQQQHFLSRVRPAAFHAIRGEVRDPEAECRRYAALLAEAPIDLACMGIGENGHIAFNDPSEADFEDPQAVKVVELDKVCREQQVHDGLFSDIASVPHLAISITCPMLLSASAIVCVVPGPLKSGAISGTLRAPVSSACPATILRRHSNASLFLDAGSARLLPSRL